MAWIESCLPHDHKDDTGQQDSYTGHDVPSGDEAAAFFLGTAVFEGCIYRYFVESAEETKRTDEATEGPGALPVEG